MLSGNYSRRFRSSSGGDFIARTSPTKRDFQCKAKHRQEDLPIRELCCVVWRLWLIRPKSY